LHSLDSVATIPRLVTFYGHEHNHVLPAFGQTPDEMYLRTGNAVFGGTDRSSRQPRAAHAWRGEPIGILQDVPVTQRGRMTPGPLASFDTASPTRAR
jgi:hypothetical protein